MVDFLGQGSFGIIKGNGSYAVKYMKVRHKNDDKTLTNYEIAAMLGFQEYDIAQTVPKGCIREYTPNYNRVWVKMLQYHQDV